MHALKLTPVGDSLTVPLPRDVLERLKLAEGGTVFLTETPEGVQLTSQDPKAEGQMKLAREIMQNRQAVLKELAK